MHFFIRLIINTLALLTVAYTVPGVNVESLAVAVVAALVFALINAFIKPVIILVTLPINIMSLGLFTLFINGILFYLVSKLVSGFSVSGFWAAFWGALFFSVVSFFLNLFIGKNKPIITHYRAENQPRNPRYPDAIDAEVVDDEKNKKS
jgi:putative membrane protein